MDPRLRAAVDASHAWYADVFAVHGIPTGTDGALWWAEGPPPRWHSAVKTLTPTDDPGPALARMEPHEHGTVADSYGGIDLSAYGFDLLFAATWLHHPGLSAGRPAPGWSRVDDSGLLARWNAQHDTEGVLVDDLLAHPRFTVLARHEGDVLTGGAVLHDAGAVVGLSNTWSIAERPLSVADLLTLAAAVHPGRAVVDYAWGDDLAPMLDAGFTALGPQHVWIR